MLLSIALILIVGMSMGWICRKIKLPSLVGMLATGILLGPYVLNLLDPGILGISAELRKIALIIILTRAGLGLDVSGLKKLGRPALLMCFVPATFELLGMLLLAPGLMGLTLLEAAILGAVLAAVSPAVVVPRMVKLMEEGYGVKEGIPQLILAGASVDDVYVIVLFSTFVGMMQGEGASLLRFVNIPVSILFGVGIGLLVGGAGRFSDDTHHFFGFDRHHVLPYSLTWKHQYQQQSYGYLLCLKWFDWIQLFRIHSYSLVKRELCPNLLNRMQNNEGWLTHFRTGVVSQFQIS